MSPIEATGQINVVARPGPLESVAYDYSWEGGDVIAVNRGAMRDLAGIQSPLQPGETFTLGPFSLRVLDYDFMRDCHFATRIGWRSIARLWLLRALKGWRWLEPRLILTLAVWGWARYRPEMVSSWHDVRPPWRRWKRR